MKSTKEYRKIRIHITTLRHEHLEVKEMNVARTKNNKSAPSKFICSICLNTKPVLEEKKYIDSEKIQSRSCPICHRSDTRHAETMATKESKAKKTVETISKVVQTSQTDVTKGLNLLNEVLTVFQSQKRLEQKEKTLKTLIFKDASVATDVKPAFMRPKLSVSKILLFSIDDNKNRDNNKCTIVNSCQPDLGTKSHYSINLSKHKSSSIPQMKMEELKKCLRDKTKSKDAIEEVNRMFATVRRNDRETVDDTNRPVVRHGPRVLPVVKTDNNYQHTVKRETMSDENLSQCNDKKHSCKFCQTHNNFMSGGDSLKCCHKTQTDQEKCDKCVYMLCCHYDDRCNKMQTGVMFCECCGKNSKEYYKQDCADACVDSATSF